MDPGFFPILEARDLFEYLTSEEQKKVMNGTPKTHIFRGPFLGRMELVKQLLKQMNDNKIHSDIELGRFGCASSGLVGGWVGLGVQALVGRLVGG